MSPPGASEEYRRAVRGVLVWAPLSTLVTLLYVTPVFVGVLRFRGPARFAPVAAAVAALAGLFLYAVLRACVRSIRLLLWPLGYPERHWGVVCGVFRIPILVELVGAALAVPMTAYAVWGIGPLADQGVAWAALVDAVFLVLLMPCVAGVHDVLVHVAVVPYFERAVGEINTFARGMCVARHLADLDALARSRGVTPLSEFGWNDDLAGEPLVWHDAAAGRKTVNALLASLQGEELARDDLFGTVDDLKRIAQALDRADERGIRFCLLLRHGDSTSAQEWEVRKGTCF